MTQVTANDRHALGKACRRSVGKFLMGVFDDMPAGNITMSSRGAHEWETGIIELAVSEALLPDGLVPWWQFVSVVLDTSDPDSDVIAARYKASSTADKEALAWVLVKPYVVDPRSAAYWSRYLVGTLSKFGIVVKDENLVLERIQFNGDLDG